MESRALNFILGLLSLLSFTWSFFSQENRIIAVIIGFLFIIVILISEKNLRVKKLEEEQKRLGEKLKIHKQLIDIKKDIEILKQTKVKK